MLTIELPCAFFIKQKHLQIGNSKLFFGCCDHFSKVHIGVGLQHTIGSFVLKKVLIGRIFSSELFSGELIPKANNLELSVVAGDDVADIEVSELDLRVLYLFEEYFMVLDVVL